MILDVRLHYFGSLGLVYYSYNQETYRFFHRLSSGCMVQRQARSKGGVANPKWAWSTKIYPASVPVATIPVCMLTKNGTQCLQTKIANSGTEDDLSFKHIGIKHSDESLLTAINDRLLFQKSISSFLTANCLVVQYKYYGEQSHACALITLYKWDANDIHEQKQPLYAKLYSHALVYLRSSLFTCQRVHKPLNNNVQKINYSTWDRHRPYMSTAWLYNTAIININVM